jgi:hypothetical protein
MEIESYSPEKHRVKLELFIDKLAEAWRQRKQHFSSTFKGDLKQRRRNPGYTSLVVLRNDAIIGFAEWNTVQRPTPSARLLSVNALPGHEDVLKPLVSQVCLDAQKNGHRELFAPVDVHPEVARNPGAFKFQQMRDKLVRKFE